MSKQVTISDAAYAVLIAHATKWSKGKAGLEVRSRLIVMVYDQKGTMGKIQRIQRKHQVK